MSICPGCGLDLPDAGGIPADPRLGASAECYRLQFEVAAFELQYPWLVGKCHQMTVDAYGAQHPGDPSKPIRLGYSLVGLHLAFDLGMSGNEVRTAHSRMGKPDGRWPVFVRPQGFARLNVLNVVEAGPLAGSPEGHAEAVEAWARSVWEWWEDAHDDVERLTRDTLGDWLVRR